MSESRQLTGFQRRLVLACALLAWLCAGIMMAVPPLASRAAVADMGVADESLRGRWFSWYVCAFLLGAATGGLGFGWLGDRFGRSKTLGWCVLTYSLVAGACYFVTTPQQLLVLWFLACTGVGGVWPNGEVFRPPLLRITVIGILLGAIPLMGNWGATNWLVPWASQVQEQSGGHGLSAATQWSKSGGAAVGSLLGGWFASVCGRRTDARLTADAQTGHLSTSLCHLGNIATRLGRSLTFDPHKEQIVGDNEANALIHREYREHWGTPRGV